MDSYLIDSHKLHLHPERVAAWLRGEKVFPLYLEIAPSGGCNHRCTFCAVDYLGYETRFLDAEIMHTRLLEMASLGVKSIMWAGEGEPLLHRHLGDLVAWGKHVGIDQAITTNGVALTERFCREALLALSWIKVSVNGGTPSDYARIHRTQPTDWERVWNNLTIASAIRRELNATVTLGVQMVLLPDNVDHVPELIHRARWAGADYVVLKPYSHHPKSETHQYEGLRYDAYLRFADEWRAMSTARCQVIVRTETMPRVTGERDYATCQATPWFWGYVMATGDVYGCSAYLGDPRFKYGNLLTDTFASIWNSDAKRGCEVFVRDELDIKECRKACRQDHANRFLWRITHPQAHDSFI